MHARIEQLLNFEDQALCDARVRQHVESCRDCTQELARLRGVRNGLKALPQFKAPSLGIRALQTQVVTPAQHHHRAWRIAAAAAVAVLSIAILTTFTTRAPVQMEASAVNDAWRVPAEVVAGTSGPSLSRLVDYSQYLDRTLHEMPPRPSTERAATSATIDSLQDHIQWVDYQLSVAHDVGLNTEQSTQLWKDRVRLMNSLVTVRYAEAQRVAML